jgi:DNA replication protein DnaC
VLFIDGEMPRRLLKRRLEDAVRRRGGDEPDTFFILSRDADPRAVELSHAEWLGLLLDREMTERQDRRLKARLRFARLRHQAIIEDVNYRAPRGLDRTLFQKLAQGDWIDVPQNLIIQGPTDPAS